MVTVTGNKLNINTFDFNHSSLIEASAGTGKTYTITYLVLRLLLGTGQGHSALTAGPLQIDQILIVTFTNAATADLKLRILQRIKYAIGALKAKQHDPSYCDSDHVMQEILDELETRQLDLSACIRILKKAVQSLDTAPICTIHSFCNRALNQIYSFEASEAFATTYVPDISYIYKEKIKDVVREIFYTDNNLQLLFEQVYPLLENDNFTKLSQLIKQLLKVRTADDNPNTLPFNVTNCLKFYLNPKARILELGAQLEQAVSQALNDLQHDYDDFKHKYAQDLNKYIYLNASNYACVGSIAQPIGDVIYYKTHQLTLKTFYNAINKRTIQECLISFTSQKTKEISEEIIVSKDSAKKITNNAELKAFYSALIKLVKTMQQVEIPNVALEVVALMAVMVIKSVEDYLNDENLISNDEVILHLDRALNYHQSGDHLANLITSRFRVALIDEFQDTDPIQFSIFNRLYLNKDNRLFPSYCYLIGDPKQSIYSFRGSDINSYLKAKNAIDPNYIYTLDTNYRSTTGIIGAVNSIFSTDINANNKTPFAQAGVSSAKNMISFSQVNANDIKTHFAQDESLIDLNATHDTYVTYLDIEGDSKQLNKKDLSDYYARACVKDIVNTLETGVLYQRNTDGSFKISSVEPKDIAVLVSSTEQSNLIKKYLTIFNLQSVYSSDKSNILLDTKQNESEKISSCAQDLIYLMEAMCFSKNKQMVLRVLGSRIVSLDNQSFIIKSSDLNFEDEALLLAKCENIWQLRGFLPAFNAYIQDSLHQDCGLAHLLHQKDGCRILTNYQQICEILQKVHGKINGTQAQLRYFKQLILNTETLEDLDKKVRLDTQEDQINIVTIHKSKGLEYQIVFLPFLWLDQRGKNDPITTFTYYDEAQDKRVLTFKSLNMQDEKKYKDVVEAEKKAEAMRLLYVAITRACSANFIYLATEKECPLAQLVGDKNAKNAAETLAKNSFFKLNTYKVSDLDFDKQDLASSLQAKISSRLNVSKVNSEKAPEMFSQDYIDKSFQISSYSGLVEGQHEQQSVFAKEGDDDTFVFEQDESYESNAFNFPRGTHAGTFLHTILEHFPFPEYNTVDCKHEGKVVKMPIKDLIQYDHYNLLSHWCANQGEAQDALATWIQDIIFAKVFPLDKTQLALADLNKHNYIPEMEYMLPTYNLDTQKLNHLAKENANLLIKKDKFLAADEKELLLYHINHSLQLNDKIVNGFIKGSLDLVCRFKVKDRYKYFVVDYKSNYLGNNYSCYNTFALNKAVYDNKTRYDIQFLCYSLALYRLLKSRDPNFNYEQDVGGVLYLFLRGLKQDKSKRQSEFGAFYAKIDENILQRFDDLCKNGKYERSDKDKGELC